MKKKSLFRKATALICCIAMCITTFMPAIYAVDSASPTITVNLPSENIAIYDDDGNRITQEGSSGWDYLYSYDGNSVIFSALENETLLGKTIFFYVDATVAPTIESTRRVTASVSEHTDAWASNAKWKVSLSIADRSFASDTLTLKNGVQKYNVTFTSDSNLSFVGTGTDAKTMSNGEYEAGNISFKVNPRPGVDTAGKQISVYANDVKMSPDNEEAKTYTYLVNSDVEFYAAMTDITYKVTEPNAGEGYTYTSTSSTTVAHGGSFSFYVTPADGWTVPTVKNGNTVLSSVGNNLYVINNITAPVTITVDQNERVDHSVVYPTGVGYEITNNSNTVTDNTDLTFTVAPSDDSYEIKSVTATVGGKVAEVKDNKDNTYTISEVKGDVVISVNAQKKTCKITVDTTELGTGTTTTAENGNVEYGTLYTFYVTPKTGYGEAKVYVDSSNTPIDPVNGTQYAVRITKETKITIVGASLNEYTVTLNKGVGFNYKFTKTSVEYSGTYTFDVIVDDAYSKSEPVVTVNNVVIDDTKAAESNVWTYEIPNVTENKIVSVSGLQINTYKVTLNGGVGYNFSSTDSTTVAYNGEFSFEVNIDDAHKKGTDFGVTATGGTLINNANGTYTISQITDDVTVSVNGVVDSTSKVVITSNEHAEVNVTSNNADAIKYGGTVTFTVDVKSGYRIENVFVNGENMNALNGTYTVNNITSDITIDVVTVANKLTVNYVSTEQNHTFDKTATYTIENISTVLSEKLDDCIVHSFNGWNYNGAKADVSALTALIAENDNTATLTAEFGLKDDKAIADSLLKLADTTKEQTQVGDKYRTTFRTVIDIIEAVDANVDPCVRDYVKVTAHGTLLANSADAVFADKVENLRNRTDKTSTGAIKGETVAEQAMFNYYVNCDYTWSGFYAACMMDSTSSQIILRITSSTAENTLNAAGWVELSVGDTNIYIISNGSGTSITAK